MRLTYAVAVFFAPMVVQVATAQDKSPEQLRDMIRECQAKTHDLEAECHYAELWAEIWRDRLKKFRLMALAGMEINEAEERSANRQIAESLEWVDQLHFKKRKLFHAIEELRGELKTLKKKN
jgi:hypothetical protein